MLETTAQLTTTSAHTLHIIPTLPFRQASPRFLTSTITDAELDTYLLRMPEHRMHELATRFALASDR